MSMLIVFWLQKNFGILVIVLKYNIATAADYLETVTINY
jgi:hypothetical protein